MAVDECQIDADCSNETFLLCYYSEYPWVNSSAGNVCGCNSWFGWVGDECDELGRGSYVFLASTIISGIQGLIGLLLGFHTLLLLFKIITKDDSKKRSVRRKSSAEDMTTTVVSSRQPAVSARKKGKQGKLFNSINFTTLVTFLALLCYTAWRFLMLALVLTPTNFALREEDSIEGLAKAHFLEVDVERYLVLVTGVFLCLALLNLSLVWIDNVKKIQTLTKSNNDKVVRYRKFLIFLELLWVVLFFVLSPATAAALVILILLISAISYGIAVHYMRKLYKSLYGDFPTKKKRRTSMLESDENALRMRRQSKMDSSYALETLIGRMTAARRRIVIGSLIGIFGSVLYLALSISSSWREYSEPGMISAPMVGNELLSFGLGFNLLAVIIFLHQSATKPISGKGRSL